MEECRAENCRAKHPHKRYCPLGHDTFEFGRNGKRCCRRCQALFNLRYLASEPGREVRQRASLRYEASQKGQAVRRERSVRRYATMPFIQYQEKVMRDRRRQALKRLEQAVGASD